MEGIQPADILGVAIPGGSVQVGIGYPCRVELLDADLGAGLQLTHLPELDRLGRAGFGAGRFEAILLTVIAEGTFLRDPRAVGLDHAEGASRDTVATAVADVGLDIDRVELRADDRAGRADFEAGS